MSRYGGKMGYKCCWCVKDISGQRVGHIWFMDAHTHTWTHTHIYSMFCKSQSLDDCKGTRNSVFGRSNMLNVCVTDVNETLREICITSPSDDKTGPTVIEGQTWIMDQNIGVSSFVPPSNHSENPSNHPLRCSSGRQYERKCLCNLFNQVWLWIRED